MKIKNDCYLQIKKNQHKLRLIFYAAEAKVTSEWTNLWKNSNSLNHQTIAMNIWEKQRLSINALHQGKKEERILATNL